MHPLLCTVHKRNASHLHGYRSQSRNLNGPIHTSTTNRVEEPEPYPFGLSWKKHEIYF
jgi:hypothetical protein